MPKKNCPKCSTSVHARSKLCKCGYEFIFKTKKNKYKSVKWQELVIGDSIKVSGGPFWENSKGIKVLMGYKGIYNVVGLDQNGIIAYGNDRGGFCHIWMKEEIVTTDGIVKVPHKIKKINN
jgi:hypothetical protein